MTEDKSKKPKSPAKLAAEASDKLDALIDAEEAELNRVRAKYEVKHQELYDGLDVATLAKLRALRAEVVELIEPEELADELDTIPTDEPTHLRDVTP